MLQQLQIQNFGLIDQLSLDFHERLNIFTGETGAGKSILLEALRIALGDKLSVSQLRDSAKACVIEAVFDLTKTEFKTAEFLQDFPTDDTTLIIHRTYSPDGRQKIKINGLNATITQLREIGDHLVDFHGPHDHQMLLASDFHIRMLDRLIDFGKSLSEYQEIYKGYKAKQKELVQLQELASGRERELDLLTHQIKELEQVPLDDQRDEELQNELIKSNNAEKLYEHVRDILDLLDGDGAGSTNTIRKAFYPMQRLHQLDETTTPLSDQLTNIQQTHDQLILELRDYAQSLSFEPSHAEKISEQCDIYESLKRKYGPTLAAARTFYEEAKKKYDLMSDFENNEASLHKEIAKIEKVLTKKASELTVLRQKAATSLKKTIEKELMELGIHHVQFEVRIDQVDFHESGRDRAIFYISPNAGEEMKPLAEIVSSGEAARVMLALKKALIKVDPVPVLIFDEIDAQIGGRLGTITGEKLRDIAKVRQVILITHLPQIASFADQHFKVKKIVKSNRALTTVLLLDKKARVEEIAQMMSGQETTEISLKHANDMLIKAAK